MSDRTSFAVRVARSVHRTLLMLAPRHVRRRYRADMIEAFRAASTDASAHGIAAIVSLLAREAADLVRARYASARAPSPIPEANSAAFFSASRFEWMRSSSWAQSWRALRHRPAFFVAASVTLAAGAGTTTAVFALVDTVLIAPLPYPDSDRLVTVYESSPSARDRVSLIAPARLEDWQRRSRTFVAISGSYGESVTELSGADPERLEARRVAPRFFTVFGTPPLVGRTFVDAEEQHGGPGAVVISEAYWARRFGRSPTVLQRALRFGGRLHAIVGVMPRAFTAALTDAWIPAQTNPYLMEERSARFFGGIGRLRPGVAVEAGAADLRAVQEELGREFPKTDAGWSAQVQSLKEARVGTSGQGLVMVLGAVGLLWTIAIANVAGLTLVQVRRRAGELAIRAALGGSRLRVAGALAREGAIVAVAGAIGGTLLAAWIITAMPSWLTTTPRLNELTFDARALGFLAGTTTLAAMLFVFVPVLASGMGRATRVSLHGRGIAGGRHRLQRSLVVGQVAMSVVLVGSAMMLLRSYQRLSAVDVGFDPAGVVTFNIAARWDEDRGRIGRLQIDLLDRLRERPHVDSAGFANFLPATGATLRYQVRVDGLAGDNPDGSITVGARMIAGDYLRAIRAPLIAGASCPSLQSGLDAPRSAIVNRRFVETHAAGQNLVGRSLRLAALEAPPLTIAGVVGDLAEDGRDTSPGPYVYTCDAAGSWPDPRYVVRTSDVAALAADLRRIVRELDPERAWFGLTPMSDVVDASLDRPRLDAAILAAFAGAAVLLAALGLYSLFMLVVSERTREMAVRLAIGATPQRVQRLVVAGAGRLVILGIVAGLALMSASGRLLAGVLFGVSALDAQALGATICVLAVVSAAAITGPAVRASRIAPIDALRGE
jgi:predicted permease